MKCGENEQSQIKNQNWTNTDLYKKLKVGSGAIEELKYSADRSHSPYVFV